MVVVRDGAIGSDACSRDEDKEIEGHLDVLPAELGDVPSLQATKSVSRAQPIFWLDRLTEERGSTQAIVAAGQKRASQLCPSQLR